MEGYSKKEFSAILRSEDEDDEEENWQKKVKYAVLKEEDFIEDADN